MQANLVRHDRSAGSALLPVLVVMGATLLVVGGVLSWSLSTSRFTERQNQYLGSVAAAEAATEQVIARISRDFQRSGESGVFSNLAVYRQLVPADASYEFSDGEGLVNHTHVDQLTSWEYTTVQTKRTGISGHASSYRIISNARELNTPYNSVAAIRREVQVASIPIFQYQLFYTSDLEICPGAGDMTFTGPVHCNSAVYFEPNNRNLTFLSGVAAARQILHQKQSADPTSRIFGSVTYNGGRDMRVNTLNLPIGTNNSPSLLRRIVEIPPTSEPVGSSMGSHRYYNKAELIVLVSNGTVVAKSGSYNGFSVTIPWTNIAEIVSITGGNGKGRGRRQQRRLNTNIYDGIISTNVSFFNKRENKTVRATEIDVGQLLARYSYLTSVLGRNLKTLYVADFRSQTSTTQSGVRVVIGETLPPEGLTLATPNPLYIVGNYNVPASAVGTTNTSQTVPASLIADAITVLSENWTDTNSGAALSIRLATNNTVNAAMIAGIVPTGGGYYSGGVENFPRLLEDWTGKHLYLNGSMVALFHSQIATAPWGGAPDIYSPPIRHWSFDPNFTEEAKLPPGTPELRTLIRSQWAMIPPDSIQ